MKVSLSGSDFFDKNKKRTAPLRPERSSEECTIKVSDIILFCSYSAHNFLVYMAQEMKDL